jgi:hypothetical protein
MKKLLAAGCCVIALQSFSQVSSSGSVADGKKVLVKAVAGIVNNEANRKLPPRRIHIKTKNPKE